MDISVAIPDSSLIDEVTKINKSRKISVIARACAIFRVKEIFIYHEKEGTKSDAMLLNMILKYLVTPQYFRRQLFPKTDVLKFAGVLQPLKIPNHSSISDASSIKVGDVREAIIVNFKRKKFVDIGIKQLIPYYGGEQIGKRIAVQVKAIKPRITIKEISRKDVKQYWGYQIKERSNLASLILAWRGNTILTSRKGKVFSDSRDKKMLNSNDELLIVFGSPNRGVQEILGGQINKLQRTRELNFFPNQATETVRLEEAILGTLTTINMNKS